MYPRIPWELVAGSLGSPEHTSGTTALQASLPHLLPPPTWTRVRIASTCQSTSVRAPSPHDCRTGEGVILWEAKYVLRKCSLQTAELSIGPISWCTQNMHSYEPTDISIGATGLPYSNEWGLSSRVVSRSHIATCSGVPIPSEARFFSSPRHPDVFWGPTRLLFNGSQALGERDSPQYNATRSRQDGNNA